MLAHLVAKEMLILEDSNFEKSFPNKSHRLERSDTPKTLHVLTHVHPLTPESCSGDANIRDVNVGDANVGDANVLTMLEGLSRLRLGGERGATLLQ